MELTVTSHQSGAELRELVARDLVPCASQFTRLAVKRADAGLSRSEGAVLSTLSRGPRRITELAESEGLAQPTTTVLVKRLQEQGWVARERDAADGRAVLISITPAGIEALDGLRAQYRAVLRTYLSALDDERLQTLADAVEILQSLVEALSQGEPR